MTRTSEELEFLKEGEMVWKQRCDLSFPTFRGGVRNKWPLFERRIEEMWESKASASVEKSFKKKLKV